MILNEVFDAGIYQRGTPSSDFQRAYFEFILMIVHTTRLAMPR